MPNCNPRTIATYSTIALATLLIVSLLIVMWPYTPESNYVRLQGTQNSIQYVVYYRYTQGNVKYIPTSKEVDGLMQHYLGSEDEVCWSDTSNAVAERLYDTECVTGVSVQLIIGPRTVFAKRGNIQFIL